MDEIFRKNVVLALIGLALFICLGKLWIHACLRTPYLLAPDDLSYAELSLKEESEELYVKLELKKMVKEEYEKFLNKYGSFKAIVDKITGAVNVKEYGEVIAKLAAEKAYRHGSDDKEEELAEKYREEKEKVRKEIGELLLKLVEDIKGIKQVL